METVEMIRFIVGAVLIICGLVTFFVEIFGVYRFRYVLNRMHSAAMGDTLGLALCIIGLIVLCGINFTSLKLLSVVVFLWLASPVSSHLIASLELTINKDSGKYEEIEISGAKMQPGDEIHNLRDNELPRENTGIQKRKENEAEPVKAEEKGETKHE